ncbi:MAG: serine/threonine protein kinase [Myxococcales bacterium]|nr:serine/threonine protein kinase [Myxococcales bacterium]
MSEHDPLIGTLLAGRYRIECLLGQGGMGSVYKARHEVLDRDVAIKLVSSRALAADKMLKLFRREARAATRVDHPNVTAIYDFGHDELGRPFIAMEHVVGRSLVGQLMRGGATEPMGLARALPILLQLAEAMLAAHGAGVVHRDLKPENVLLTRHRGRDDFVKVLDFGLARLVDAADSASLLEGDFYGTPAYMSPEQCACKPVGPPGDVYSFGIIAYEMTCGVLPFNAAPAQLLYHHQNSDPPPPATTRGVSSPIDPLLLRCLSKDPDARGHAVKLTRELRELSALVGAQLTRAPKTSLPLTVPDEGTGDGDADHKPTMAATIEEQRQKAASRHARRRALDELAVALAERGLGGDDLVERFAAKLDAEDEVLRLEAELDLLEVLADHHEQRSREREARLRPAIGQQRTDRGARGQPGGAERAIEKLRTIASLRDARLEDIARRTETHRHELDSAVLAANAAREALIELLRSLRSSAGADAEMMSLYMRAGV